LRDRTNPILPAATAQTALVPPTVSKSIRICAAITPDSPVEEDGFEPSVPHFVSHQRSVAGTAKRRALPLSDHLVVVPQRG
jgi:hypothetical protein